MTSPARGSGMAIPIALFLGLCVLSAATYFGLRSRAPDETVPIAPSSVSSSIVSASSAPPSADLVTKIGEQARIALEKQRPTFFTRCWLPALKVAPDPKQALVDFELTFDTKGQETQRLVREGGEVSRKDVVDCLTKLTDATVSVPAPGRDVTVVVSFPFP